MRFVKYHGLGNDFIVPEGGLQGVPRPATAEIVALCRRGAGIGADGLLLPRPADEAHLRMELVNADGSVPEMCGNGIRCLVRHAVEALGFEANPIDVETPAGIRSCRWTADAAGRVATVRVDMGRGRGATTPSDLGDVHGAGLTPYAVDVGNPHLVLLRAAPPAPETTRTEALARDDRDALQRLAPPLAGPERGDEARNVEIVRALGPERLLVQVWERGCGPTAACGTGACAAVYAAVFAGLCPADAPIRVSLPGGDLSVELDRRDGGLTLEGPAEAVYRGELLADGAAARSPATPPGADDG